MRQRRSGRHTLIKDEARRIVQRRLVTLPQNEYKESSRIVCERVRVLLDQLYRDNKVSAVLSYHAIQKWREIDLSPLENDLPDVRFDRVPLSATASFPDAQFDIIFVPLYGFNSENYRLGHGSGWYDKYLAMQAQALKVGVGLELNRVEFILDPYDVPMDEIITDR